MSKATAAALVSIILCAIACQQVAAQTDTLKVATFNILQAGTGGGEPLSKTRDVILASGADVVGIQEADGAAANLAQLLGWQYREFSFDRGTEMGNTDGAILTRFPITQTLSSGIRVQL